MNKQIENIWNEYNQDVGRFLRSKSADLDLNDDIRSSVFEKLIFNYDKINDKSKIKFWLLRTAKNELFDTIKKQKNITYSQVEIPELQNLNTQLTDLSNCVVPLINKLDEKQKEVLLYSDIEEKSQLDLATKLDISYSGLKSRVQRARKKLLPKFHDCCDITLNNKGQILDYIKKGNNSIEDCSLCSSN